MWWARSTYGLDSIPNIGSPDKPLPMTTPHRWGRALRIAHATYRQCRLRTSPIHAGLRAWEALRYYTVDLTPRVGHPRPVAPDRQFRTQSLCWRMIPMSMWHSMEAGALTSRSSWSFEPLVDGVELIRAVDSCVVRWGEEIFVPTVW